MKNKQPSMLDRLERLLEKGKPYEQWEWDTKFKGEKVMAHFNVWNRGQRRTGSHPEDAGESPELELLHVYDYDGNEIKITPKDKSDLEDEAAEQYYNDFHG